MTTSLEALSPIDGRYLRYTASLRPYFSELALFKYRVQVEIEYLIALSEIGLKGFEPFTDSEKAQLRLIYQEFGKDHGAAIKEIEKRTNHDIKAVEYFIKEQLEQLGLGAKMEWVHFGLTSQDINNTAIPLSMKEAAEQVIFPALEELCAELKKLANTWKDLPMLARTHGQAASPTTLGKEIYVFAERIEIQIQQLKQTVWAAKFGGATGNFNAHHVAFPSTDWLNFAHGFVSSLGLSRSRTTTQIEHYDHLAAYCQNMMRVHTILIDFCRDIWMYISMEYFRQRVNPGETGSSAMPHKVNPIDFENAEGNLGIANALLDHFAQKLPISRLQRDLTDSTVLRNIGVPFAHSLISIHSIQRGLGKLLLNESAIAADLNHHTAVIAEAIQTILRREGYPQPYEALKGLTRGNNTIDLPLIHEFIRNLNVSDAVKAELLQITPANYTGIIRFEA
ncbi:MAG TPA: adenylosuccinate lyase [Flavobacteriales bacterium]|nr:adenylosuccinate lyase [Flavobacteriales bacterium]HPH82975.1 adenylosuccinate lyase [Flavobacteriales bacterium]